MTRSFPRVPLAIALSSLCASGCAIFDSTPAGLAPGKFVSYTCEKNHRMSARLADDRKSVRVRSDAGSAELTPAADGTYTGDGYTFFTSGEKGVALRQGQKWIVEGCRAAG